MFFTFPFALFLSRKNKKITLLNLKSIQVNSEFNKLTYWALTLPFPSTWYHHLATVG